MRRGLVHVDWVISFGIFIIFLLLMFIWFGPTLTQEYDDQYLKNLAQKGIQEACFSEVWQYPIFIEVEDPNPVVRYEVKLPDSLNVTDASQISVVDESRDFVERREFDPMNNILTFSSKVNGTGLHQYKLICSPSFNFNVSPNVPGNPSIERNITVGIGSRVSGFSEILFYELADLDYAEFKERLKYPKEKNLAVYIYEDKEFLNLLYNYSKNEPTKRDNVYVSRWTAYAFDRYGWQEARYILVKTW